MPARLVVPASSDRFIARARYAEAAEVVLDLEDAVPPAGKVAARERAVAALAGDWGPRVAVRVNAPGTPWGEDDLRAVAGAGPVLATIVLPKVSGPENLAFAAEALGGAPVALQALIETPQGVAAVNDVARAGHGLEALILGYADLGAALGRPTGLAPAFWQPVQDAVVIAAKANGLAAIDGPCLSIGDADRLSTEVAHARACGFDAKWAIHPSQLDAIRRGLAPTDAEVERARAVLAALDAGAQDGRGAVELDGEMLDEVHRAIAERTLVRAQAP